MPKSRNTIKLDINNDDSTYGYKIYRKGPYEPNIPSLPTLSGTLVNSGSLSEETSYYYAVSPYGSGNPARPTYIDSGNLPIQTSVNDLTVNSFSVISSTGVYYSSLSGSTQFYGITYWREDNQETKLYPNLVVSGYIGKDLARLSWSISSGINATSDFYGTTYSGYKIYRSSTGDFGSNSLLAIITGLEYNITYSTTQYRSVYVDSGYSTTAGSPNYTGSGSGIGIMLNWEEPTVVYSGYYVYRSTSRQFGQNSLIAITTGVSSGFFDSGIEASVGAPLNWETVGTLRHPTSVFEDENLVTNSIYEYAMTSYNAIGVESPLTTGYTIRAGDLTAPSTPKNVYGQVGSNGFFIHWENGNEVDLEGTEIWYAVRYCTYSSFFGGCTCFGRPEVVDADYRLFAFVPKTEVDMLPNDPLRNMTFSSDGIRDTDCSEYYLKVRNRDYAGNTSEFG